ncbi:MAG: hypothetical protein GX103_07805 [Bacteroidales bacterium]|nr:hypothetical protein [Bacteroidales bacterium]
MEFLQDERFVSFAKLWLPPMPKPTNSPDNLDVAAIQRRTVMIPGTIGHPLIVVDPSAITIATSYDISKTKY